MMQAHGGHRVLNKKCIESLIRSGAMDSLPGNRRQKVNVYERAMDGAGRSVTGTADARASFHCLAMYGGNRWSRRRFRCRTCPDFRPGATGCKWNRKRPAFTSRGIRWTRMRTRCPELEVNARLSGGAFAERPILACAWDTDGRRVEMGGLIIAEQRTQGDAQSGAADGVCAAGGHVRRHGGAGLSEGVRAGERRADVRSPPCA